MSTFKIFAVQSCSNGFMAEPFTMNFDASEIDVKAALFGIVEQQPERFGDCFFISGEDFSPITFDCTFQIMGGLGKPYPSDQWSTTYNKFIKLVEEGKKKDDYVRHSNPFCRIHKSKSGKAGEFFNDFDTDFSNARQDKTRPFAVGIFNNPKFYFK